MKRTRRTLTLQPAVAASSSELLQQPPTTTCGGPIKPSKISTNSDTLNSASKSNMSSLPVLSSPSLQLPFKPLRKIIVLITPNLSYSPRGGEDTRLQSRVTRLQSRRNSQQDVKSRAECDHSNVRSDFTDLTKRASQFLKNISSALSSSESNYSGPYTGSFINLCFYAPSTLTGLQSQNKPKSMEGWVSIANAEAFLDGFVDGEECHNNSNTNPPQNKKLFLMEMLAQKIHLLLDGMISGKNRNVFKNDTDDPQNMQMKSHSSYTADLVWFGTSNIDPRDDYSLPLYGALIRLYEEMHGTLRIVAPTDVEKKNSNVKDWATVFQAAVSDDHVAATYTVGLLRTCWRGKLCFKVSGDSVNKMNSLLFLGLTFVLPKVNTFNTNIAKFCDMARNSNSLEVTSVCHIDAVPRHLLSSICFEVETEKDIWYKATHDFMESWTDVNSEHVALVVRMVYDSSHDHDRMSDKVLETDTQRNGDLFDLHSLPQPQDEVIFLLYPEKGIIKARLMKSLDDLSENMNELLSSCFGPEKESFDGFDASVKDEDDSGSPNKRQRREEDLESLVAESSFSKIEAALDISLCNSPEFVYWNFVRNAAGQKSRSDSKADKLLTNMSRPARNSDTKEKPKNKKSLLLEKLQKWFTPQGCQIGSNDIQNTGIYSDQSYSSDLCSSPVNMTISSSSSPMSSKSFLSHLDNSYTWASSHGQNTKWPLIPKRRAKISFEEAIKRSARMKEHGVTYHNDDESQEEAYRFTRDNLQNDNASLVFDFGLRNAERKRKEQSRKKLKIVSSTQNDGNIVAEINQKKDRRRLKEAKKIEKALKEKDLKMRKTIMKARLLPYFPRKDDPRVEKCFNLLWSVTRSFLKSTLPVENQSPEQRIRSVVDEQLPLVLKQFGVEHIDIDSI